MAVRTTYGIHVPTLRSLMKEADKRPQQHQGWSEEDGCTYYTNGFLILRIALPFQMVKEQLKLADSATPRVGVNLKACFDSFSHIEYRACYRAPFLRTGEKGGASAIFIGKDDYALVNEFYTSLFPDAKWTLGGKLKGIRCHDDLLEAYILPVRPKETDQQIVNAMRDAFQRDKTSPYKF